MIKLLNEHYYLDVDKLEECVNIHGHTHANRVKKARGVDVRTGEILYSDENDVRYHCVCVEQTDFAPILFEDVIARIEAEGGSVGFKNGNFSNAD